MDEQLLFVYDSGLIRDDSAKAGYDYIPTAGTLTLNPGEQWAKIWVQTLADDTAEGDETFSLVLENPVGASFPDNREKISAERTIEDDISLTGVTDLSPAIFDSVIA